MAKEVKIGLAVGTCFVLLAAIWYFGFSGPTPEETDAAPKAGGPGLPAGRTGPGTVVRPAESSDTPPFNPLIRSKDGRKADLRIGEPAGEKKEEKLIIKRDDRFAEAGKVLPPTGPSAGRDTAPVGPAGRKSHVIKPGETFWSLAQHYYGDPSKYKLIEAANPGMSVLRIGATVTIPEAGGAGPRSGGGAVAVVNTPALRSDEYVVKVGDRFDDIIRAKYGSLTRRDEILALNKDVLKGNADVLKPKMILRLPAGPAAGRPPASSAAPSSRPASDPPAGDVARTGERFRDID
jgi:nucleoid-associated protein YgaU